MIRILLFAMLVVALTLTACSSSPSSTQNGMDYDPFLGPIVKNMQKGLVNSRVQWEGMLDIEDLKPGLFVNEVGEDYVYETLILSQAYTDSEGDCRFDAVWLSDGKPIGKFYYKAYCADLGMTEYTGLLSGWNQFNHLILTGRPNATDAELNEFARTLRPAPGDDSPAPERQEYYY